MAVHRFVRHSTVCLLLVSKCILWSLLTRTVACPFSRSLSLRCLCSPVALEPIVFVVRPRVSSPCTGTALSLSARPRLCIASSTVRCYDYQCLSLLFTITLLSP